MWQTVLLRWAWDPLPPLRHGALPLPAVVSGGRLLHSLHLRLSRERRYACGSASIASTTALCASATAAGGEEASVTRAYPGAFIPELRFQHTGPLAQHDEAETRAIPADTLTESRVLLPCRKGVPETCRSGVEAIVFGQPAAAAAEWLGECTVPSIDGGAARGQVGRRKRWQWQDCS